MKRQAFQRGEIRDENDNIISEGAYGKKTAFANKTNDGILDYIVNNFQALFDMISGAYVYVDTLPSSGDSDKLYVVNSTGKTYRWDGKQFVFVSEPVDGLSAYEIAKQNGFEGTEQEWIKSIVSDTIESAETDASGNLIFTMKSGGKIKTTLQPIVECINYMNLSKKWAVASESPDNESDTESETGKTLSSKSWALTSKTYASQAKKSETNATNSENNALQYKNAANDSKTAAATSASSASKSEANAKASANVASTSATAANTSASNAKLSETHASTSETNTKQALAEAQKIQKQIESDVATLTSAVKYKGSVNSFSDLPAKNAIGDMYNIKNAGGTDSNNTPIKAGDNVVWNGTGWDNQSGFVDLSDYTKNSEVSKTIIDTTCSDDTVTFIHKDGTKSKATINNVLQATRANQDGDGNDISETYYKKVDASTAHQSLKTTLDGKINKSGDTMTGALNLANHTWNLAGDDAYFGDANKSGCLCVKGANNDTGITLINRNDTTDADCAIIRYAGKNIVVNKSIDGNITGTAETAKKLHTYYDRPASANKQFGDGNIYYYLATTSMTEGKPPKDSHIIHLAWDNQSGWDSQIAISHDNHAYWRYQNGGKWGNWRTFLDSDNFNTYAPKLDGTGATGNWNINAKTATAANSLNNAITHQIYNSNDNGGRPKLLLLYDVTTWYDKNSDTKQMAGFNGIVSIIRPNGFGSEKIILLTAFVNYTNYDIYSRNLYTSSSILVPCIVQRASDKKYFLALKCNFSSYTCDFIGRWTGGNPLFTEILYASGEGLPAGYTIVYDGNTNYPFSATNATNDSNGNAINTTYLKKADFIQQVHPVNSVIMLANGTDPNKIYSNTSWVKINTDTLGSISVNYWQRTT